MKMEEKLSTQMFGHASAQAKLSYKTEKNSTNLQSSVFQLE